MSTADLFHGGDRPRRAMEERLETLFQTGGDIPSRWIAKRLILQNYWLYPYQEFHFGNGRLVLRGPNGSGKTSVLVSAVTLTLDGRTTRSRLDPFGQSGRSMAYYLLGKADAEEGVGFFHEDRTGYVAMEFQHGGDDRFLTVGVGMRGRRFSGGGTPRVDSWGFVVRDGRRVGRDRDLELTTEVGVPLTRAELTERVGTGGVVLERTADYQAEVNRALFGFADEEDYAFLLQILLSLRSPKLNKELKPSDVAEILSESLPPLDPALLERVTQIMDDIDATRADIATTETNHRLVGRVHTAVGRLANQIAQERALDYRERNEVVEGVGERLVAARESASRQREEHDAAKRRLREADQERTNLQGRLKVLRNHEAYRGADSLSTVQKEVARVREQHSASETAVRDARDAVAGFEKQRSGLRDRWSRHRTVLVKDATEFGETARDAVWPFAEQQADEVQAALKILEFGIGKPPVLRADALEQLVAERRRSLEDVLQALAGVSKAQADLERANSVVEQAQAALANSHSDLRAASQDVDDCRDRLGSRLEQWSREEARELTLRPAEMTDLRAQVHRSEEPDAVNRAIVIPLALRASHQRGQLEADRNEARSHAAILELRLQEARSELDAWEAREEAAPERRPGQEEARASLASSGVMAVPLFEAVEVRAVLPADRVRTLQASLQDSGLLDALVVGRDGLEAVTRSLGPEGGDRWIRPQPLPNDVPTLADILEPAPGGLLAADVVAALRSVALRPDGVAASDSGVEETRNDPRAGIDRNGRWNLGPLSGQTAPTEADGPLYLGRESRVRERNRQVARLRSLVQQLDEEAQATRASVRQLDERIRHLDASMQVLRELPEIPALTSALTLRAERSRLVRQLNQQLESVEQDAAIARRAVGAARTVHQEALRQAPAAGGRDADGVRLLLTAADRVVTVGQRVGDRLQSLSEMGEELNRIESTLARSRATLSGAETRERAASNAVTEAEARAQAIETDLRDLGYDDIMEAVRQGEKREEELVEEGRKLAATIRSLEDALERARAETADLESARAQHERARSEARTRLGEAVHAYPTLKEAAGLFGEGKEGGAMRAADALLGRREERPTDLRRRIGDDRNRAWQALTQEVTESRSALIDYHPALNPDTGAVSFRHEGRELPPHALLDILTRHRQQQINVMREKEDELYEQFFLQEVSGKIREAIERAEESVERVNALLNDRPLANDEILSLRWRPAREIGRDGADHPRLVQLLKTPASVLPPEDVRWIKSFFHERVRNVREAAQGGSTGADDQASFAEALRAVLDYRRWFTFTIHAKRLGEASDEITNRAFAARSGGEKSLAMFVPLLAAVDARFRGAHEDAPKLVGLDEAFAGVDSDNITQMFAFMVSLDLSWIMTSEKLWGVSAAIPVCTTYQFHRRGAIAAVQPWLWDGTRNIDEPSLSLSDSSQDEERETGSGAA